MEYITSSDFHFKNTAVALGKFEGIHRGHQLLMDEVKKQELVLLFFTLYRLVLLWMAEQNITITLTSMILTVSVLLPTILQNNLPRVQVLPHPHRIWDDGSDNRLLSPH